MRLDRWASVFFHRGAIFKTMTSNGEQGAAFCSDDTQGFFFFVWLESAPLFHITWIRGQEWTMCAWLWRRQASVLPAHFIHPCWQPVYHSDSTVGPHLPNASSKQRLLLETWYYNHCHDMQTHNCSFTFSAPWSALCFSSQFHHSNHHHLQSWRNLDSAAASLPMHSYQSPLQSSLLWVEVSLDCFEHLLSIFSPLSVSHLLLLQFLMESTQRLAYMQAKLVHHLCNLIWPLLSPSQCYIIWCLHFLCVPLCSHYLPFIGCDSAAQHQTNSLSM